MMQTIEALINEKGKVHFLEPFESKHIHRVFITILPNEHSDTNHIDITKLGEVLDDDLESASKEISKSFQNAIEKSAQELKII